MRTDGRTDRQTDRTKLKVVFPKFANASKNKEIFNLKYAKSMLFNISI